MTQPQVPLNLAHELPQTFARFTGNQALVETLSDHQRLPQFTYLWGVPYSGKTHLMRALAEQVAESSLPHMLLDAAALNDADVLDQLPGGLNYLLLDDVQTLQGVSDGEVALFNVYNRCRSANCRLIVAASCSARSELWQLPDLKSRLTSGLTLHVEPLSGDQALECFKQQFIACGIPLEQAVIEYVKNHQNTAFDQLFELFRQLASQSLVKKRKVTVPLVKETLAGMKLSP